MQIEARNISFQYRENTPWILKDVSLKIEEAERVGLVGPSGYGKSTLVKILAGYLKPTKGRCFGTESLCRKKESVRFSLSTSIRKRRSIQWKD